jgi:hypothetical protein
VRPRSRVQITYCNGIAGLRHSALITMPRLFESHYHNITGRTILIVKINYTTVCFILSEYCLFVIILKLKYTNTYLSRFDAQYSKYENLMTVIFNV